MPQPKSPPLLGWYLGNTFITPSPHHLLCQKLTLSPDPMEKETYLLNCCQPNLICFHKQTPYSPQSSLVYQSLCPTPYLLAITWCQNAVSSVANRHSHLPIKAWLKGNICLTPRPPIGIGVQMVLQLTTWYLNSSPIPPHRKSLWIFSIRFATLKGMGNRERK